MENICRITAFVLLAIAVITGFIGGIRSGSFMVFITMAASGFVSFISLYTLGEVLDYVKYLNQNITELRGKIKDKNPFEPEKQVSMPRPAYDIRTVGKGADDKWLCPKCKEQNESTAMFCKNCGEYK